MSLKFTNTHSTTNLSINGILKNKKLFQLSIGASSTYETSEVETNYLAIVNLFKPYLVVETVLVNTTIPEVSAVPVVKPVAKKVPESAKVTTPIVKESTENKIDTPTESAK